MMRGTLAGKIALVTGAARGIGAAIARLFHAEGACVLLADVLDEAGAALAAELGERAVFRRLDVAEEAAWQAAVAAILASWDRLDVLVNNAAILRPARLLDVTVEDAMASFRVNQLGVLLGMKTVAPAMKAGGGGSIVNLSSIGGLVGRPGLIAYGGTKWAVRGMTKVAAAELGPDRIRVNSIHPGVIETEMTRHFGEEGMKRARATIPMDRIAQPEEVAQLALYLASDASSYSTGGEFAVDGGLTAI